MHKKLVIASLLLLGMVRGDVVWTEWKRPLLNTDGSLLTDLKGYAIYITSDKPYRGTIYDTYPVLSLDDTVLKWPFLVGSDDCFYVQLASINNKGIESKKTDKLMIKGKNLDEKITSCPASPSPTPGSR